MSVLQTILLVLLIVWLAEVVVFIAMWIGAMWTDWWKKH